MKIIKWEPECIRIVPENEADKKLLKKLDESITRDEDKPRLKAVEDGLDKESGFIIWKF